MGNVIDSHHHFWRYNLADYGWIADHMKILRRDFLPPDLQKEIEATGVDGVISVQASQSLGETASLLEMAEGNSFIRGVVGWAPLVDPDLRRHLDGWVGRKKLLGLRHVLQGEPDDRHMLRPDFDAGIGLLREYGLRYDILILEKQLCGSIEMVDRHPEQMFIVDHIAKPKIAAGEIEPWASQLRELARRPNVYCKISGMPTEANWQTWTPVALQPYFQTVLEAFTPRRLMFGSDWPVCLLATSYQRWHDTVQAWIAPLSSTEKARIWGETAIEAYGLDT